MQTATTVLGMRRLVLGWRKGGRRIGFVPTMGYLHEGHVSLMRRARRELGAAGKVVVSIYVNPTQFGPGEDYQRYPRDLKRDLRLCRQAGVDAVFAPADGQMYPSRAAHSAGTGVIEPSLSQRMEGASRPGHFKGVTTVVAKLFNIVQPDIALFGAKDFQQAAVIRRMVRDLHFPVRIIVAPTLREPDGLAMSSRNKYLQGNLRTQSTVLWRSLNSVRDALQKSKGKSLSARGLKAQVRGWIEKEPAARLDYVEFFDPQTFEPVQRVTRGAHMALAVFIGQTRLIDNTRL